MYRWEFTIDGPQGTPYQGRLIKGVVTFPAEYPYKAPNVVFIPPLYHVNINLSDGMPDLLKLLFWSTTSKMIDVFKELISVVATPEPNHAIQAELGELCSNNKEDYYKEVSEWAAKNLQPSPKK